ncbi:MAG: transcription-repair coupling factor [Bacillota bacterium]
MRGLIKLWAEAPVIRELRNDLRERKSRAVYGLSGAGQSLFIAGLAADGIPTLVIVPDDETAMRLQADLRQLLGTGVSLFLPWELFPEKTAGGSFISRQRLASLEALVSGKGIVVVPAAAILRALVPPGDFSSMCRVLEKGDTLEQEELVRHLAAAGYQPAEVVETPGKFCRRGGIVDFFPPAASAPVRVEFFGDVIDSLRFFDPVTQRSQEKVSRVAFGPATEGVYPPGRFTQAAGRLEQDYRRLTEKAVSPQASARAAAWVEETAALLRAGTCVPNSEALLPYFYNDDSAQLLDYLPAEGLVVLVEPHRSATFAVRSETENLRLFAELLETGACLPLQRKVYKSWSGIVQELNRRTVLFSSFLPEKLDFGGAGEPVGLLAKTAPNFLGRMDALAEEVREWRRTNSVAILVRKPEQAETLIKDFRERNVPVTYRPVLSSVAQGDVVITLGQLSEGIVFPDACAVVLTEAEVFGRRRGFAVRTGTQTEHVGEQPELRPGDYVVHPDHGIGNYKGLATLTVDGVTREYALVQYAGQDRLYIPADQVGVLERYVGGEDAAPRLSRLGGGEWKRAKSRAMHAAREVALDLLSLYAAREAAKGYAFSPDTPWQREFEDAFPYEETPDQLRAIADVKADMEKPRPMDRLLCGDVGYGKTEVALRAAFKALMDEKQVAVLVPTTILAQQHYQTFKERFSPYPVEVAWLCRFQSQAEQREVIQGLKTGKIDIVIGTHRLLQEDVGFADLGLVIIDEEQRFGVAQKEKLKLFRREVDVLTMTATPIPRTLYMSLTGIRDTSILATPPPDRLPVETHVVEENPVLVREAIRREIARGGQVYFVYNRVVGLDEVAAWVKSLVPEARVVQAHGQMPEEQLERVMLDFIARKSDVLVATTIIENGLDIGNVNTLIVKDADRLGLAQLYQLRGRVGRTNRLAYTYFMYRRDKLINEAARQRLQAIRDFTDLGAGFKIARRDLEIRGAGNILGMEQHGHIQAVGFELYCRLLREAVEELRGEAVLPPVETLVELPISAYLPEGYVPDRYKMEVYRAVANAVTPEDLEAVEASLRDRYGPPPQPLQNLLSVALLRAHARRLRVRTLIRQGNYYRFIFAPGHSLKAEKLAEVAKRYSVRLLQEGDQFEARLPASVRQESIDSLKKLTKFLVELS